MMRRMFAWLKALFRWLAEASLAWLALLVVVVALLASLRHGAIETEIRVAGLFLQWLGIGTVAHGLHKTRKLFQRPSVTELIRGWLSRFPRWRQHAVVGVGGVVAGVGGVSGRAYGWSNMDPAAPIEARLEAVIRNVDGLNQRLLQLQTEMDSELRSHSKALREEQQLRAKDDRELQLRLEAAETGGIHISFIGVVWLFVGVLLSTVAPEIARWVS
jgi:hypothetical protein